MFGRRALAHTAGLLAGLGGLLWAAVAPHQPLAAHWFAAPVPRAVVKSPVVRRHVSPHPRPVTVVSRVTTDTPPPPFVASYARPLPGPPPQPVPPEPSDTEKAFNSVMADTTPQAVLIDLQINGLVAATVQAYRVRTEVLLPLAQLLSLAEVRYRLSPDGVLEATVEPGSKKLVVAATRDTMMFGDRRVRIEREFRLYRDGELFIGAERLGNLLDTRIVVSWSELTAIVMDPSIFPVGQRAKRESAREGLRRRQGRAPADMMLGLERRNADGLVLDYSGFLPGGQSIAAAAYTLGLGADVFGGSLALGLHSVGRADAGVVQGDGSWTGVWEDNPWVRQVRIGDGYSTGPRLQLLRGASITNAPFMRSPLIGTSRYLGRLEPGWSVEAYQNGQLIAFDTTDAGGGFGFDLPVRYGENPVDFVAYGPLGDVRQFDRTYRVLGQLLPVGRFEYGLSGGSCRVTRCTATGNLDLRYGLTPRVTLEGGADRFWRDSLPNLFHPYALVTANPTNDWAVEVEAVAHALARASLQYEPSIDLHVQAEAEAFDSRTADPLLVAPGQRSLWGISGFYRPLPGYGFFYLEGSLSQLRTAAMGTTTRARLGASVQADEARFLPYVRIERQAAAAGGTTTTRPFVGVSTFLLPRPHWGKLLSSTFFRSTLEAQVGDGPAKVTQTSLYASRPLWSGVSLDAGVVWQRGTRGPFLQMTINTYLPALRSYTTVTTPSHGPSTVSQLVQGSLLWDGATHRVTTAPGPSIERAGVAGRVFFDQNANGKYDPGEPPVPNVRVVVGTRTVASDSSGAFRVWDLIPFEPVDVLVDSLSLDSPLIVPSFATATLVPNPNRFRTLDIPIEAAGVIEGRVLRVVDGTRATMGAVMLRLTERRSGAVRHFTSFSDGAFYLMGVKPGDYELTAEGPSLEAWQVTAETLRFTLAPTADGVGKTGLELLLRPKP